MSALAATLLIISAFSHAGWNFISKKARPSLAFYFVANTVGVVCLSPLLLRYHAVLTHIPPSVWVCAAMSGLFLTTNYMALAGAYRAGDMSIAYPLARSLPAIFIFLFTLVWGSEKAAGIWVLLGIMLTISGCMLLPRKVLRNFRPSDYFNQVCILAVVAAVWTTCYTIVDGNALRILRELPGRAFHTTEATFIYLVIEATSCSIWLFIFVVLSTREREGTREVLKSFKGSAIITGIGLYFTYGLVLASMNFVTNITYVAALRQLSIPIGAMFGMVFLKEPRFLPKIIGVGIIFGGIVLVAVK